jgi:hypothetical protein
VVDPKTSKLKKGRLLDWFGIRKLGAKDGSQSAPLNIFIRPEDEIFVSYGAGFFGDGVNPYCSSCAVKMPLEDKKDAFECRSCHKNWCPNCLLVANVSTGVCSTCFSSYQPEIEDRIRRREVLENYEKERKKTEREKVKAEAKVKAAEKENDVHNRRSSRVTNLHFETRFKESKERLLRPRRWFADQLQYHVKSSVERSGNDHHGRGVIIQRRCYPGEFLWEYIGDRIFEEDGYEREEQHSIDGAPCKKVDHKGIW